MQASPGLPSCCDASRDRSQIHLATERKTPIYTKNDRASIVASFRPVRLKFGKTRIPTVQKLVGPRQLSSRGSTTMVDTKFLASHSAKIHIRDEFLNKMSRTQLRDLKVCMLIAHKG